MKFSKIGLVCRQSSGNRLSWAFFVQRGIDIKLRTCLTLCVAAIVSGFFPIGQARSKRPNPAPSLYL